SLDDKFTYLWGKNNSFEAGAGVDFMKTTMDFKFNLDPELEAFLNSLPGSRAAFDDIKDIKYFNRYRVYLQNKFAFGERFYFQPSLRFDHYDILNKSYFAPRVSFSYALNDLTTLRAVWGIYYQSPGYEKQMDQNRLVDLNDENTRKLHAERAIHYVFGIERWLTNEWRVRGEGYYKDFTDLILQQKVLGSRFFAEQVPGKDPRYKSGWTNPVRVPGDSITQVPIRSE